jgi:hypothetical protein
VLPRDLSDDPPKLLGMAEIFEHDSHKRKPGSGRRGVKLAGRSWPSNKRKRPPRRIGGRFWPARGRAARAPPTQPWCGDYIISTCVPCYACPGLAPPRPASPAPCEPQCHAWPDRPRAIGVTPPPGCPSPKAAVPETRANSARCSFFLSARCPRADRPRRSRRRRCRLRDQDR